MRLALMAVGRLPRGPERALVDDYLARAGRLARPLGVAGVEELELEPRRRGPEWEAEEILARLPEGGLLVACDERGEALSSRALAALIAERRDAGARRLTFLIGGPDGLAPAVRARAARLLAFGPQTWPHALVRVMLAEQTYRALSILAGAPYHRD